ncbi:MAG: heparinase II/III family protein [Gemmatimonadota bacterium]|nr:heparinase II/III family protein [Gemmatimonadota bacterium]
MQREHIEAEIRRRADVYKPQTHLIADYYRVRRKIAYPLPIRELTLPELPIPGIQSYPWSIWMTWSLEERILSLGWAASWLGDGQARRLAVSGLDALADWPCYRQLPTPDLSSGHALRILWHAHTRWDWLPPGLRRKIERAFHRHIEDTLPMSDAMHGAFDSKDDILALKEPHTALHNIPFIGTVGLALAANGNSHPSADALNRRLEALVGAILDLRETGHSEGVGYDGYILDFAADWLGTISPCRRAALMDHPRFGDVLDESIALGAPGDVANIAQLSDTEPREMPFHVSGHAKLYRYRASPRTGWYLNRCGVRGLRADALAALRGIADDDQLESPRAGAIDAHYAVVLRSGWEPDDLAVAMAASNSKMSHVQNDNGTIVIGARGRWPVSDPGYQQYMKKREREFTLGPTAHNAPVINGMAQTGKPADRRVVLRKRNGTTHMAELDLTDGYPAGLAMKRVARTLWLSDRDLVVVADQVRGGSVEAITYCWHGHPDAAWWVQDNMARVYAPDLTLWIGSPQARITDQDVDRLPGSRGHLTLRASADPSAPCVWWVFAKGDTPPDVSLHEQGCGIRVDGRGFEISRK